MTELKSQLGYPALEIPLNLLFNNGIMTNKIRRGKM